MKIKENVYLLFIVNFDAVNQVFTEDFGNNSYARMYYVSGKKIYPDEYSFSAETVNKIKEENNYYKLADYYIYDSLLENDSEALKTLQSSLDDTNSEISKAYLNLKMVEYYYMIKKHEEAIVLLVGQRPIIDKSMDDFLKMRYRVLEEFFPLLVTWKSIKD